MAEVAEFFALAVSGAFSCIGIAYWSRKVKANLEIQEAIQKNSFSIN
jgi:hypothetical protein